MSTLTDRGAMSPTDHIDESERALVDALVPRQRSRAWGALIVIAAGGIVAAIAFATLSGTVVPRVSATTDSWGTAAPGGELHFTFRLHNDGMRPATVTAIGLDAAGLDHPRVDVRLPIHLAAHRDVRITATFAALHCTRINPRQYASGIRVTARGDLPFATTVTAAILSPFTRPFAGLRTYSGTDPLRIGWPAGITQDACGRS